MLDENRRGVRDQADLGTGAADAQTLAIGGGPVLRTDFEFADDLVVGACLERWDERFVELQRNRSVLGGGVDAVDAIERDAAVFGFDTILARARRERDAAIGRA